MRQTQTPLIHTMQHFGYRVRRSGMACLIDVFLMKKIVINVLIEGGDIRSNEMGDSIFERCLTERLVSLVGAIGQIQLFFQWLRKNPIDRAFCKRER